jgi:apolipoprotein N-acyltransferase
MAPAALTSVSIAIVTITAAGTLLAALGAFWLQNSLNPTAGAVGVVLAVLVVAAGALLAALAES